MAINNLLILKCRKHWQKTKKYYFKMRKLVMCPKTLVSDHVLNELGEGTSMSVAWKLFLLEEYIKGECGELWSSTFWKDFFIKKQDNNRACRRLALELSFIKSSSRSFQDSEFYPCSISHIALYHVMQRLIIGLYSCKAFDPK